MVKLIIENLNDFKHPLYRLSDVETGEIIDSFDNETDAEKFAKRYIRKHASNDNPIAIDCYRIEDEDSIETYPAYIPEEEYLWTIDSHDIIGNRIY